MKKNNDNRIAHLEMNQANMGASLKKLEIQVGQLAHSRVLLDIFQVIWRRIRRISCPSLYRVEKNLEMEKCLEILKRLKMKKLKMRRL